MPKHFKQIRIEPTTNLEYNNGWSVNLLETDRIVLGIAIYSLPGTRF
jgi:hypothetical protein